MPRSQIGCNRIDRRDTGRSRGERRRRRNAGDVRDDGLDVACRVRLDRRHVEPLEFLRLRAHPPRQLADVPGLPGSSVRKILRDFARDHQPLGVPIDDVIAGRRELSGARHEVQVHPCVDAQTRLMGVADDGGQRVERRGLTHQLRRARFQLALVYASARPRTCTSSALKPWSEAVFTSAWMLAGEDRDVLSTQSARTSEPACPDAIGVSEAAAHTPTTATSAIVARRSQITRRQLSYGSSNVAVTESECQRNLRRRFDFRARAALSCGSFWSTFLASMRAGRRRCVSWRTTAGKCSPKHVAAARTFRRRASSKGSGASRGDARGDRRSGNESVGDLPRHRGRRSTRGRADRERHHAADRLKARILVVNDALVALEAGAPNEPGVVVIAGTGSIAYGRNSRNEAARAGGWATSSAMRAAATGSAAPRCGRCCARRIDAGRKRSSRACC